MKPRKKDPTDLGNRKVNEFETIRDLERYDHDHHEGPQYNDPKWENF